MSQSVGTAPQHVCWRTSSTLTPSQPWPWPTLHDNLEANRIERGSFRTFLTRAQQVLQDGEDAVAQREEKDARSQESDHKARQCEFRPYAYKWFVLLPPQKLRLVRCENQKLWAVHNDDTETAIQQRFHNKKRLDGLHILENNLYRMLSKTRRLERLEIAADIYEDVPDGWKDWKFHHLRLGNCMTDPVASRLKELTVFGKFSNSHAYWLATHCPNLETLAFEVILNRSPLMSVNEGWDLGMTGSMDALRALKSGCPKLTTIPLIELSRSTPYVVIHQFFALLSEWPSLHKVLVHSYMYSRSVLSKAMAFENNRGSFGGKLNVECGYDDFDEFQDGEVLIDQPHVSVRMQCCAC